MELMAHMTQPDFVYVHEWTAGDLVVWDNRCLVHAATWFDADKESRVMWRTTVSGNPGPNMRANGRAGLQYKGEGLCPSTRQGFLPWTPILKE